MTKVKIKPGTLEPEAEQMVENAGSDMFDYHVAALRLSQAASAKRQADALERIAESAEQLASCVMSGFGDPPEFNTRDRGVPR